MKLDKNQGRKTKYNFNVRKVDRLDAVQLDGESPYAEYLPARFKQYVGKEALEHDKKQSVMLNQSKLQFLSKMSDMASVYRGHNPLGMRSERPMSLESHSERGSHWNSPNKKNLHNRRGSDISDPRSRFKGSKKSVIKKKDSFLDM